MSYFYTSATSNIPSQPHPSAVRMTRTGSSSSTSSTSSSFSAMSIPYNSSSSRPGSSSASFSSSYWPCSSSSTASSPSSSSYTHDASHSRHPSNGTSYLPTPFRSALLHSSSSSSSTTNHHHTHHSYTSTPSSYFSDEELLSLTLDSPTHHHQHSATSPRELTTEEQVAAVRAQVEREREGAQPEAWWQVGCRPPPVSRYLAAPIQQQQQRLGAEKRSRVVRFVGEPRPLPAARGKRRSAPSTVAVQGNGRGSGPRD